MTTIDFKYYIIISNIKVCHMIENRIVPNVNIFSNVSQSMPIDDFSKQGFGMSKLDESGQSFKDVLTGLVSNVNNEIQKPDQLLQAQMMGNTDVDIHDVVTAIAKADLGVTMAVQMTSKVVAAYNTIMNILWLILRERFISYKSAFDSTRHCFIRIPSLTIVEEWLECSIR